MASISFYRWSEAKTPLLLEIFERLKRFFLKPFILWHSHFLQPYEIRHEACNFQQSDPLLAKKFYRGEIFLAGQIVYNEASSPFEVSPPSKKWQEALHNFSWLKDFHASDSKLSHAYERLLWQEWLETPPRSLKHIAWQLEPLSERIIAWLSYYKLLNSESPVAIHKQFLKMLTIQFHYLRFLAKTHKPTTQTLIAHIALSFAALCLNVPEKLRQKIYADLEKTLDKQIYPDGGHLSRNPAVFIKILAYLLGLKASFVRNGQLAPMGLTYAIERLFPALRFFLHEDGSLARFNGVGYICPNYIKTLLKQDSSRGHPLSYAPHSGYKRLHYGQTTVIADVGTAPNAENSSLAHAGCLSFEMSSDGYCFIVNNGAYSLGNKEDQLFARSTQAHSTAMINHRSQGEFFPIPNYCEQKFALKLNGKLRYQPLSLRDWEGFSARHNFYEPSFQLQHERGILLHKEGRQIEGYDRFFAKPTAARPLEAKISFHLHPAIEVSFNRKGQLRLEAPNKRAWLFSSPDARPILSDSIFYASGEHPKGTKQILFTIKDPDSKHIRWRFVRIP